MQLVCLPICGGLRGGHDCGGIFCGGHYVWWSCGGLVVVMLF